MNFKWKINRDGHKERIPIFQPLVNERISVMATKVFKHLQKKRACWPWWRNSRAWMKLPCSKPPSLNSWGLQASLSLWLPPSHLCLCLHVASPLCPRLSSSVCCKDPDVGFRATRHPGGPHFQILRFTSAKTLFSSQVLFWGQGAPGLTPSRVLPSHLFQLLGAPGIHPWAGGHLPPVSTSISTWLLLCVHVSLLLCLIRTLSLGLGPPLFRRTSSQTLHSITSAETPFPNNMPLWGSSWTWVSEERKSLEADWQSRFCRGSWDIGSPTWWGDLCLECPEFCQAELSGSQLMVLQQPIKGQGPFLGGRHGLGLESRQCLIVQGHSQEGMEPGAATISSREGLVRSSENRIRLPWQAVTQSCPTL